MFFGGKKGHFKKECRFYKKWKTEANGGQKKANVVEDSLPNSAEIVAMVGGLSINVVTECNLTNCQSNDWWYDSGSTVHVCNDKNLFKDYQVAAPNEIVLMGNHNTSDVLGKGTVELEFTSSKTLVLTNVYHVPDIRKNLVSASVLCNKGLKAVIEAGKVILSKNNVFVGQGYSCNGMFKLSINKVNIYAYLIESSIDVWHARLSHVNFRSIKFMSKHGLISCTNDNFGKCETCLQAKMTKKPFPKNERTSKLLEIIHSDICELNGHLTRGGNRYFITFIDDHSRFTYVYLLRTKDQAFDMFKLFKTLVENQ